MTDYNKLPLGLLEVVRVRPATRWERVQDWLVAHGPMLRFVIFAVGAYLLISAG